MHRQRPGTAKGVVFLTLEDESGQVNVIVQSALAEKQRQVLTTTKLMVVTGIVERDEAGHHHAGQHLAVVQFLACRLGDLTDLLGGLAMKSRDFR